jgi:nucleoside-diphosphate-sugar epimerase
MSRTPATDELLKKLGATAVRATLQSINVHHIGDAACVVHAAGCVGGRHAPQAYFETNVAGTQNVLKAAMEAQCNRFIHLSSDVVVFDGKHHLNLQETTPYPKIKNAYAASKQAAEMAVRKAGEKGNMTTICLRPRFVWGKNDPLHWPAIAAAAEKGRFFWVNNGKYLTSTAHVSTVVNAVGACLLYEGPSDVFFIADNYQPTHREFWSALAKANHTRLSAISFPRWLVLPMAAAVELIWNGLGLSGKPPVTKFGASNFCTHFTLDSRHAGKSLPGFMPLLHFEQGLAEWRS